MSGIEILLLMLFNLLLIAILYWLTIQPLQKQLNLYMRQGESQRHLQYRQPITMPTRPDNVLPDMDDIPLEALYGDEEEEDYRTRPEDVEDALTERTFNSYNPPRTNALQQLKALNSDGAA